ncbi:unnamed protein product [Somion occarium]|uniref:Phosphatidic acid phosphatase type 2/haloperoxidase domain-containing protein n=1 Tax=Somion occarium TaxID=3059160 RepID=A0ABP1CH54_9APHY
MGVGSTLSQRARLIFFWALEETNFIVTGLTACTILYTRSSAIVYFALGAVVCSRVVKLMKKVLRQPRPVNPLPGHQKGDYGMPSTHSGVISYYAAYSILACKYLPIHSSLPDTPLTRVLALLVIIPWAATIAISRIWLGHHTWQQVTVGCSLGIMFTPIWFLLWTRVAHVYGEQLEQAILGP